MNKKIDLNEFEEYIDYTGKTLCIGVLTFGLLYIFFSLFIEWEYLFLTFLIIGIAYTWFFIDKYRESKPACLALLRRVRNVEHTFDKLNPYQKIKLIEQNNLLRAENDTLKTAPKLLPLKYNKMIKPKMILNKIMKEIKKDSEVI